jgi:hypothetical protein
MDLSPGTVMLPDKGPLAEKVRGWGAAEWLIMARLLTGAFLYGKARRDCRVIPAILILLKGFEAHDEA